LRYDNCKSERNIFMPQIELGWTNLLPCSRIKMVTVDGPFGTKFDTPQVQTAEQRLYAYADIESPNWQDKAIGAARDCALAAVGAAGGIAALTANPAGAGAAFGAAFLTCFAGKFADVVISSVHIETSSRCMW
jgi:hypothetical protein